MSFVLNIPSTFKTSTIPSIFGDNILTGNQTLNGNLKVNQSMTLGSGIMSDSSYESMEITQTLHVDEHSIFNRVIVEQSMNVVSSSQLDNVISSNMELTNLNISSEGESEIVAIIRDENIDINSLYTQDISFSNIYVLLYNLSLSDISLSDILSFNYHIVLIDEDDDENSYTYISLYDLSFSNYSLYDISLSTFTIESIEISHLLSDCLLYDASLTTLEVTNIDICGHLHVQDISFSNIEVEKLILSDLSVNNATIANLSVNSVELETPSLNNRFSILANEVSQVFSGQSSVLYAFMAKGSSNYSISSGTTIPFVTTNTFDTIVIRRPTGTNANHINLRELQMWVNNSNVLPDITNPWPGGKGTNDLSLTTITTPYFILWDTKLTISSHSWGVNIANDNIVGDVHSPYANSNVALYIPLTTQYIIDKIQSFVLYNRSDQYNVRSQGLAIELYNRANDPTLSNILSYSDEISSTGYVYRFDYNIDSYTGGFSNYDSTSQIINSSTTQVTTYIIDNIISGWFETELSDFNNYSYTMDGSSSGIWHFGVHGHCINTSTTDLRLGIFRNDELIIQSQITQQNIHIHSTFYCETNDVIQVKCTMGTGYIDLSNSCFFGYKYNPSNNNIEQNTNIIINSLDMSHNENVTIEQGHLLLESGNLEINHLNSGNIKLDSGNIKLDSGNIELDSGNIYANHLDVSNIITTQLQLLGNMDLCGNLSIQSSDYSISNERLMFDTIVIRRVTSGDNRWIGINEVQLWINNTNVMPGLVLDSIDKNQDVALEDISNIPFFIDWTTKTCDAYHSIAYPHNIANENIDITAYWGIRDATSSISQYNIYDVNVGLYVPLTSILNVNDVQSLVIYSRVGHESMFTGAIIEFYNRSIDPTLNTPIISTPEIISDSNTNRFDFPSLYTYNSFVSSASITNIIDSANSAVYNVASKKIVNSSNVMSSIKSTHENDLSFDTIVIRRPTGYSGDGSYYINLRELQCWVDNSNILYENSSILDTSITSSDGDSSSFISYYTFDESFNDTTTNNYHLYIRSGSPEISTTQYKFGSSLYFNGSSTLETSDFTLHNRSFSIALWVYVISSGTRIIEQSKAATTNQQLHIALLSDRNYRFGFWDNDLDSGTDTFNLNEWHHVVFQVKSNGNREIYYNGSLVASDSNTLLLNVDDNPIIIGGISSQFNGYIDDLRFYNRELTTSEIDDIYTYKGFSLIIRNIPSTNINDIQSLVLYNITDNNSSTQGGAIELYNRSNDPSLNVILASTKIISQTANVYRFDFPSIYTYTKGFAKGDSTYQIASSSHALTEVFSPNDVIGLTLDNCKMGITTFHDYINVEGSIHTNGQVVITNQSTDDNKYFMKYNIDDSNYWNIYTNSSDHIYYNYGGNDRGFISSSSSTQMNFTGQHRCFIKDLPTISNEHIGLIVCANQNVYISMNEVKYGNEAITQNESLPYVSLCIKNNDKSCFGVISASEDPNIRKDEYGSFVSVFQKEKGDTRIYINSVGEGALWIINKNGVLESGDYITTCDISGYGMKQTSDDLKNYSVAKITMDCDFNPSLIPKQVILKDSNGENILNVHNQMQWTNDISGNIVYEYQYKIKYINQDASEISQQEYIDQSNNAYIAAYVGCTYHCG